VMCGGCVGVGVRGGVGGGGVVLARTRLLPCRETQTGLDVRTLCFVRKRAIPGWVRTVAWLVMRVFTVERGRPFTRLLRLQKDRNGVVLTYKRLFMC